MQQLFGKVHHILGGFSGGIVKIAGVEGRHFLLLVILRLQGVGQFLHGAYNAPGHKGGVVAVKVSLLAIAFQIEA
mgnify:FL=1